MASRAVGEHGPTQGQPFERPAQFAVGLEATRHVDVVDVFEVGFGIDSVVADQPLEGHAVFGPIAAAQPVHLRAGIPTTSFMKRLIRLSMREKRSRSGG